ncbi:MAG: phasin family protein [Clostridia bacterium]
MENSIGEEMRKLLLAGIGAVATTAEKSKELVEELIKKGELTVKEGKVLNEELAHNIKEKVNKKINVTVTKCTNFDDVEDLSEEQLADLKAKIEKAEKSKKAEKAEKKSEKPEEKK